MMKEMRMDEMMAVNGGAYPECERKATEAGESDSVVRVIIITAAAATVAAVTAPASAGGMLLAAAVAVVSDKLLNKKY